MRPDADVVVLAILSVLLALLAAACSDVDRAARRRPGATASDDGRQQRHDDEFLGEPVDGLGGQRPTSPRSDRAGAGCTVETDRHRRVRPVPGHCRPATWTRRSRCGRPGTRRTTRSTSTSGKGVVDGGELGITGKIGWYVPTYMLDEHPELATWEGLKGNADLFATAETRRQGPDARRRSELRVLRPDDRREPRPEPRGRGGRHRDGGAGAAQ